MKVSKMAPLATFIILLGCQGGDSNPWHDEDYDHSQAHDNSNNSSSPPTATYSQLSVNDLVDWNLPLESELSDNYDNSGSYTLSFTVDNTQFVMVKLSNGEFDARIFLREGKQTLQKHHYEGGKVQGFVFQANAGISYSMEIFGNPNESFSLIVANPNRDLAELESDEDLYAAMVAPTQSCVLSTGYTDDTSVIYEIASGWNAFVVNRSANSFNNWQFHLVTTNDPLPSGQLRKQQAGLIQPESSDTELFYSYDLNDDGATYSFDRNEEGNLTLLDPITGNYTGTSVYDQDTLTESCSYSASLTSGSKLL